MLRTKPKLSRLLILVSFFGISIQAVAQAPKSQPNLLPNGRFLPRSIDQGQPVGWVSATVDGKPKFLVDRKTGHDKKVCVKITSAESAKGNWSATAKVKPNSVYRLTAWVKTKDVESAVGRPVGISVTGIADQKESAALSGTSDWSKLSLDAKTENSESLTVNLNFASNRNGRSTAWFDDIKLVLVSSPDSLGPLQDDEAFAFYTNKVKPILQESCFQCHAEDPEDLGGSLALTSRASILRGGDTGPAVDSSSPNESLLLKVINYDIYEMPPEGKLSAEKINTIRQWVELGMPFPPGEEKDLTAESKSSVPQVNEETKKWWSFQPVADVEVPHVKDRVWPKNEIDNFVLAKLESVSLKPAKPISKRQLIRRAHYDLTGLPPTPQQVEDFNNSEDPGAYKKLIDELLESPHYGEKWGRHWLDLVRYAESNSFERDGTKPFVWRYRDYVIQAFNQDKPYDQFLLEQLAGDELKEPTPEQIIATGYYRLGAWDDEPADPLKAKYDDLDDIIATTGQTMLGLTVNCARCHDHKIDPIPQADYYKMVSFFENIRRYGVRSNETVSAASIKTILNKESVESHPDFKGYKKRLDEIDKRINEIVELAKPDFESVEHEDFKYDTNKIRILKKRVGKQITQKQFDKFRNLTRERKEVIENPPGSMKVLCVKEKGAKAPESFIRIRGNPHVKGEAVKPGFPSVLSPPEATVDPSANGESTGRRLAFAKWLVKPENPLTSRVMVNRLWQFHFGRGIVRTTSDFGFQGAKPSHPELLDWLAAEFVKQKWSIKQMHRLIMMSNAYQMASTFSPEGYEKDPANDLFWRFNLRRLTAEEIRDSMLAVSGELNREKMFGPSVFPIMPKEVLAGQSQPGLNWGDSSEEDRRRRSIYIHVKRSLGLPILTTNDSADTDSTCPVRFITTQPTQALGMMNSEFSNRLASKFAERIRNKFPEDRGLQISSVLELATQRPATNADVERGKELIQSWIDHEDVSADKALEYFCLMALNLNEFAYVD